MTPLLHFYHAGVCVKLHGDRLSLSGLDALPAERAARAIEYAKQNKVELLAELQEKEAAYATLLELAQYDGLRFWFSDDGLQGAPIHEPGEFRFGLVTGLWMAASPLQYQRHKELLEAVAVVEAAAGASRNSCLRRQ